MAIAYEKYENMDKKAVFKHLIRAEARLGSLERDFKAKIEAQRELVKFLKDKMKKKLREKDRASELDLAIEEFRRGEVIECEDFDDYQRKMRS